MKARIFFLVLFCLFLLTDYSIAQKKGAESAKRRSYTTSTPSSGSSVTNASSGLKISDIMLEGTEGNMYVGDTWPAGSLVLKDGKTIDTYRYRYDIYADQMQFIDGNDTLAFASPSEMQSVSFDGKTFIYSPYECTGMLMKGYFQQTVTGRTQLLLKRTVVYHLKGDATSPEGQKETYLVQQTYFIKHADRPAQKVLFNKKSVLDILKDHRSEMEAFVKKSGNKVRNADDVAELVKYFNSLK